MVEENIADMTPDEIHAVLMIRKAQEESECFDRLQQLVQNKVVPIDPVFVMVHCRTVDTAIEFYIDTLEREIKLLKRELGR